MTRTCSDALGEIEIKSAERLYLPLSALHYDGYAW